MRAFGMPASSIASAHMPHAAPSPAIVAGFACKPPAVHFSATMTSGRPDIFAWSVAESIATLRPSDRVATPDVT